MKVQSTYTTSKKVDMISIKTSILILSFYCLNLQYEVINAFIHNHHQMTNNHLSKTIQQRPFQSKYTLLYLSNDKDDDDDWGVVVKKEEVQENEEKERDLFIPIFSIVSLLGLFGAYGYEMLRLYLRGELYLPWNN